MILQEAGLQFCHQEEEPYLPSLSHPRVAQGDSLCLLQATEVVPQSPRGTECLPQGPMWAQNLIAPPLQYLTHQGPFSQVCTTGGPPQCPGLPGNPVLGLLLPLSLETEVLLLEEAPYVSPPRAPPLPSPIGPHCPLPPAGLWMTNLLLHLPQWATGPPCTERPAHLPPLRTANPQCLPPHGLSPPHRPHLRHHHLAGPAPLTCLQVPVAVTKSQDSHSGTCPSLRQDLPYLHQDVLALFLLHPVRDPLPQ